MLPAMHTFLRSALAAALAATLALPAAAYDSLVVFGDSLSDSGNNRAVLGNGGAGQAVTGNAYIPSLPYASGTYTNGPVWATDLAASLGLPLAPSVLGGTNYAYGGSRTGPAASGFPFSLLAQTGQYLAANPTVSSSGLYVLAGGGNNARDALQSVLTGTNPLVAAAAAANAFVADIGSMVDALQAAGAVDILVWNVPNLGVAPAVAAAGAAAQAVATGIASAMNQALAARLATEGPRVKTFDLFGFNNQIAAAPALYGFTNTTDACGAVGNADCSRYVFWDGIHPTAAAHAAIAQAVQLQVSPVPEPETWALMLGGLAALGWRARRRAPRAAPAAA
jgi:outer membrane lipase/esterase